jgi:hypothetical protein
MVAIVKTVTVKMGVVACSLFVDYQGWLIHKGCRAAAFPEILRTTKLNI